MTTGFAVDFEFGTDLHFASETDTNFEFATDKDFVFGLDTDYSEFGIDSGTAEVVAAIVVVAAYIALAAVVAVAGIVVVGKHLKLQPNCKDFDCKPSKPDPNETCLEISEWRDRDVINCSSGNRVQPIANIVLHANDN